MKNRMWLIIGVALTVFIGGCGTGTSSDANDVNDSVHVYPQVDEGKKSVTFPLVKESDLP